MGDQLQRRAAHDRDRCRPRRATNTSIDSASARASARMAAVAAPPDQGRPTATSAVPTSPTWPASAASRRRAVLLGAAPGATPWPRSAHRRGDEGPGHDHDERDRRGRRARRARRSTAQPSRGQGCGNANSAASWVPTRRRTGARRGGFPDHPWQAVRRPRTTPIPIVDTIDPMVPPLPQGDGTAPPTNPTDPPQPGRRRRRVWYVLLAILTLLTLGTIAAALVQVPYYLLSPGSTRSTEGLISVEWRADVSIRR